MGAKSLQIYWGGSWLWFGGKQRVKGTVSILWVEVFRLFQKHFLKTPGTQFQVSLYKCFGLWGGDFRDSPNCRAGRACAACSSRCPQLSSRQAPQCPPWPLAPSSLHPEPSLQENSPHWVIQNSAFRGWEYPDPGRIISLTNVAQPLLSLLLCSSLSQGLSSVSLPSLLNF